MAVQTVTARLQIDTAELRQHADGGLDAGRPSWLDYRLYLFRMYGFHATAERALSNLPGLESVVPDAGLRNNKLALLAHDLVSLGVDRRDLHQLPRVPMPPLQRLADALGWMYVLESATLETKPLARQLAQHLPLEIESAAAYLDCYGDDVSARWKQFEDAVDEYAEREQAADAIISAAQDCLLRLHRWLRPPAPVRHAASA